MASSTQNPNWEALVILSHNWVWYPTIVAIASCVCKSWYAAMTNENVWKAICIVRWPSISRLSEPPGFSFRRYYSLRHLPRRRITLSLNQLVFVVDVFRMYNGEPLLSFVVLGEDLTPTAGEEGNFCYTIDLGERVLFPETELGVECAVMLKGWESVFTILDGGEDNGVEENFIYIGGELPGRVFPQLGLGFSPSPVEGILIAEKVSFALWDSNSYMTVDSALKYLENFLLPSKV